MYQEEVVLCSASHYAQKFYLNEKFGQLPQQIKDELKIITVLFTEEVGGIIMLVFNEEGELEIRTEAYEEDILYDEIGSALKVKQLQMTKQELFYQLEQFYELFFGDNEG